LNSEREGERGEREGRERGQGEGEGEGAEPELVGALDYTITVITYTDYA